MSFSIERASAPPEFRALHALLIEYERTLPVDLRHGSEPELENLERDYAGESAAFIARVAQQYAGCVVAEKLSGTTALLKRMYVQPAYRGRGIARALAQAVIDFAGEHGYARVVLDTDRDRLRSAHALYVSLGFAECDPFASVTYDAPTYMELRLR